VPSYLADRYPLAAALPPLARSNSDLSFDSDLRDLFGEESSDALTLLRVTPWLFTETQRQQILLRELHFRPFSLPSSPEPSLSPQPSPVSDAPAVKVEPAFLPSPVPDLSLSVPGPLPVLPPLEPISPLVLLPVKQEPAPDTPVAPATPVARAFPPVARLSFTDTLHPFPPVALDTEIREVFGIATSTHYTFFKCAPGTFSDSELQYFETFHRTSPFSPSPPTSPSSSPSPPSTPEEDTKPAARTTPYSPTPSTDPEHNLPLLEYTQPPFDTAARFTADPAFQALCQAANKAFAAGVFLSDSQSDSDSCSVPVPVPVPVPSSTVTDSDTVPSPTAPDPVYSGYAEYEV